ncbi:MAG TPA: tRNA (adenosine(37)-N6)-threonylcarbamoyltransferase complex ATPase subunit type 1 TsaE [Nitrospirae bacterium]|nr:tRNA threonylcarbamoyladenosine biosynthesis protein TsaE [bacterium BMS3Abin10]GBE38661.1 tRNA threonylcarbamoyladenosine biosynthesis protein TsaE [bacterium BMS3Bbin08]HDH50570.1 tRNA (adenosine(37)-N6)-threonylcarbamoyltransferase complex ATPase subunit type 1 TsaE [Nitrospirota bacterium]HDO25791.1 tRNA (adenosine(37)-N6)-threonylcarbamoyltransferase complex ATPase subunit type 1 TsaE [Nitrospirota bacterium]HDZ83920.1 tRNA (adenosine(37)-N6)-threonylcarbamoyltransferase complex ATPase 
MFQSKNESETKEIGRRLGKKLKAGDIVCLYGELGTGKTTMVKGIASVMGIDERDITSASFTIIAEYSAPVPFYHIDLYRIESKRAAELGLREYLYGDGISVIEWAERAEAEIPDGSIRVRLKYAGDDSREIEIKGIDI